jgi:hypothetical protein
MGAVAGVLPGPSVVLRPLWETPDVDVSVVSVLPAVVVLSVFDESTSTSVSLVLYL